MLNTLIGWSVNNRLLVVLALLGALVAGSLAIDRLNLDAFPDVTNVQVAVNTEAPGLAAEDVEKLISYPIESVMYALPGVAEVRSVSKTGLSLVTVVFEEGTDLYLARQLVFERLAAARALIPAQAGSPEMGPNTSGLGQVFQYLLVAEPGSGHDAMSLRSLNDYLVKLMLMPVEGITEVLSFGGQVRQYQVLLSARQLLAHGLSQQQVMAAIEANNLNAGGWYLERGRQQLVIRGVGWLPPGEDGLAAIAAIPVKTVDGVVVRVGSLAEVRMGPEIRQGAVSMSRRGDHGQVEALGEVVSGIVLKRMGANTKATIDAIKARLDGIQAALPAGVSLVPFYDQADLVAKAVDTVVTALLLAFGFILVVLALFLLNLRATLLVILSIPLSIGLALLLMAQLGMSANLMSLGGLAVAIGMLVDGSVVMVENIFKHLGRMAPGGDKTLAIMAAGREVARPIFFAAAIVLLVFAPLFSLEGVEGKLFQPMALSMMLAVAAAVLVALLVVPALASLLFRAGIRPRRNRPLERLEAGYRRLLGWVLDRTRTVLALVLALLGAAAATAPFLGTEFVPELEEGTLNLRVTLAPTASLDTALAVASKLEAELMDFPEVIYALSRVGRPELGGDPEPVSNVEIYIGLKPVDQWTTARDRQGLQQRMAERLAVHPGLLFNFSQPIATRVDELLSGVRAQLAIKLFGPDLEVLADKGRALEALVRAIDGTRDVAMEQLGGEAQLVIRPRRDRISRYGLAVGDVMALVSQGLGGASAGQVVDGNERYPIQVRLAEGDRQDIEAIKALWLQAPGGARVQLGELAEVGLAQGPVQIRRDDVQRRLVIQANVGDRDMGSVVADIQAAAAGLELPSGYSVKVGGQFESQARAQATLALLVPGSVLLIAVLLYFAFGSVGQALLILLNVPLALIGGVFSLAISGQYLSVPGSVGFITLFGVAVQSGVVLVDAINQRLAGGAELAEAVIEGAVSRLRPVLMTALTSALGLIPMLMSSGVGSEIQRPLAAVVVGGLVSATALTLLVLPAFYGAFSRGRPVRK
ncbi:CusA/CzcA family heavy metal efflux RND transporter [Gallaecimonas sp. GXIMD4217]|uniref:efflux RND transporter permease subunit n=1 Tax=Gallaecimonas sp. GXIMD4217 TaxID=3131927 RepID=UPI00311B13A1